MLSFQKEIYLFELIYKVLLIFVYGLYSQPLPKLFLILLEMCVPM